MVARTLVHLEGFKELDRALAELPKVTAKNTLRRVGRPALEPMADRAAALAPELSGRLSFTIGVSEHGTRRARWKKKGPNEFLIAMGPMTGLGTLSYATHVEFGTVDTPAEPFMRPAWDAGAMPALDYIKKNLGIEIGKSAARLAKRRARAGG